MFKWWCLGCGLPSGLATALPCPALPPPCSCNHWQNLAVGLDLLSHGMCTFALDTTLRLCALRSPLFLFPSVWACTPGQVTTPPPWMMGWEGSGWEKRELLIRLDSTGLESIGLCFDPGKERAVRSDELLLWRMSRGKWCRGLD